MKTKISWNCALQNGADLYVNEGLKLSECLVNLTEEGGESRFLTVWFSMKTAVLEGDIMYTGSISHIDNESEA